MQEILKRHVAWNCKTQRIFAFGHNCGNVAGFSYELPCIGGKFGQPLPAFVPAVFLQYDLIGSMARTRVIRRTLSDLPLELWIAQQVFPRFGWRGSQSPCDQSLVVHDAIWLKHCTGPETLGILKRHWLGGAHSSRYSVEQGLRDLMLNQESVSRHHIIEHRFSAPDHVSLWVGTPLADQSCRQLSAFGSVAGLHIDTIIGLRPDLEGIERSYAHKTGNRGDQVQLSLDLRRRRQKRGRHNHHNHQD